ncbi:hypothetical protein [Subtercola endophyticus]|uniref:hypothetical protein n=1 Tax=Subtercola endophyticus TaxID=2895559 RepID=UPI001E41A04E|nr:hypothetical protein [Subtercola endophyticus]UFS58938.1 hypothetical protein LQ955_18405 [Subtercola endophyticus]
MISDCDGAATEEVTINDAGLLLVYAVCPEHLEAVRSGAWLRESSDPKRGLIGPA